MEHAKTMPGTVREPYVEVLGRVQETLFQNAAQRPLQTCPERGLGTIFQCVGSPLGVPGHHLGRNKRVFRGPCFR